MFSLLRIVCIATACSAAALKQDINLPSRVQERTTSCTPAAGTTDDTLTIQSAIAQCPSGTIVIPAGRTYNINSVLSFTGCSGCTLQIEGTLKVSGNTDYWNGRRDVFSLSGITGAKIYSSSGTGVIDGNGQSSWDRFAKDTSYDRPTLFSITGTSKDITVQNLKFKDAPNVFHSASVGTSNIKYIDVTLSAVSKSTARPKNTDGWDVSGSHIIISGARVINDDDCVAFKPGANYVTVTDITCSGSHGLSVGSLGNKHGATDTVSNIYVDGATMTDSTKAAGIKLYPAGASHGSAVVKNVTFSNVVVNNSDYAFQIQSCYNEDDAYCTSTPSTGQLTDIVVKGFSGTTSKKYDPVVANMNCPKAGSCGLKMSAMTVKAPSGSAKYLCANTPNSVGVTCSSGASG